MALRNQPSLLQVRCREIEPSDFDPLVSLLHRSFPERSREHYELVLDRLSAHATPQGFPRYGYVLEVNGSLVGAILVIFSTIIEDGVPRVRANPSNWCVEPQYRGYGSLLRSRLLARMAGMSREDSTLLNVTPARHTVPILMLNGYKRLCSGVFAAIPTLSPPILRARVAPYTADLRPGEGLTAFEVQVLRDHADYGCSSVICTDEGQQYPFVFSPRRWVSWKGVPIGAVTLSYCRSVDDFVRFAGPLGRHLAKRAVALVFIDANGPIPNLRGRYLAWGPKFYRGPKPPRLGDLAYTELVMFSMRRALLD